MKLTTENSNTTTKWRAPYIVHYIRDREWFRTQLVYAIGRQIACRRFPVVIANSATGGKASLVIGSPKNVSKQERNALLSRPLCRANSNRRQNGRGYPVELVLILLRCLCCRDNAATPLPSPGPGTAKPSNRIYIRIKPPMCVGSGRVNWGAKSNRYITSVSVNVQSMPGKRQAFLAV